MKRTERRTDFKRIAERLVAQVAIDAGQDGRYSFLRRGSQIQMTHLYNRGSTSRNYASIEELAEDLAVGRLKSAWKR